MAAAAAAGKPASSAVPSSLTQNTPLTFMSAVESLGPIGPGPNADGGSTQVTG